MRVTAEGWQLSEFIRTECCNAPVLQAYVFIMDNHPTFCIGCYRVVAQPAGEDIWCLDRGLLPRGEMSNEDLEEFQEKMTEALQKAAEAFKGFAAVGRKAGEAMAIECLELVRRTRKAPQGDES